jgi:hypothetical protein
MLREHSRAERSKPTGRRRRRQRRKEGNAGPGQGTYTLPLRGNDAQPKRKAEKKRNPSPSAPQPRTKGRSIAVCPSPWAPRGLHGRCHPFLPPADITFVRDALAKRHNSFSKTYHSQVQQKIEAGCIDFQACYSLSSSGSWCGQPNTAGRFPSFLLSCTFELG